MIRPHWVHAARTLTAAAFLLLFGALAVIRLQQDQWEFALFWAVLGLAALGILLDCVSAWHIDTGSEERSRRIREIVEESERRRAEKPWIEIRARMEAAEHMARLCRAQLAALEVPPGTMPPGDPHVG